MTAKQELYLRMPVSAFTAEIRAQKDGAAGGHGVMTAEQAFYIPADELWEKGVWLQFSAGAGGMI